MKTQLKNYLNVRYSTQNLTDEEFNSIVDDLAEQLEQVSFVPQYTDAQLYKDWMQLKKWTTKDDYINSTNRIGMKLCEHFFPNFYDIADNKGNSFHSMWKKENLIKILRWNRKSHSTPYLSELKRGIYFCCGMTKSTMYRPQMMKMICDHYSPKIVLDPCMGWGGRMLGAVASGAHYIGFDPNTLTYDNLKKLAKFLNIEDKVTLICDDAMNMDKHNLPYVDLILTSPPYFDLEVYTNESTQSISNHSNYRAWSDFFLKGIIKKSACLLNEGGVSCWNVGKVGKNNMFDDVRTYQEEIGYKQIKEFLVVSSKRQALQKTGNNKSNDNTVVYKI
jgi:16S rRNA G966 N2-methylase RsmD